jgi:hypothetical protein
MAIGDHMVPGARLAAVTTGQLDLPRGGHAELSGRGQRDYFA